MYVLSLMDHYVKCIWKGESLIEGLCEIRSDVETER